MSKILLLEGIHPIAKERLSEQGFDVSTVDHALSENELIEKLPGYDAVGIRSKTHITQKVLEACSHLKAIGTFCIGTNQVDLLFSNQSGVPVFNAPYSNTRSVAELVIGLMISLSRRLGDVNSGAHKGQWDKSAKGSFEIRGKTLGIIGYGHIGTQVSVLAEGMGLNVIYYDIIKKLPLGNANGLESLNALLAASDFVSLHVPETNETKNLIQKTQLAQMKKGSYLINASRGSVVDINALAESIKSGHIAGAAVDVYPKEPASRQETFTSELQNLPNVILTPHIGGSTEEAQESIGREVSESFIQYLKNGSTNGSVNFPQISPGVKAEGTFRLINIHKNVPGVLKEINDIISSSGANIKAQFLATDSNVGYVVIDSETALGSEFVGKIEALDTSIKTYLV